MDEQINKQTVSAITYFQACSVTLDCPSLLLICSVCCFLFCALCKYTVIPSKMAATDTTNKSMQSVIMMAVSTVRS